MTTDHLHQLTGAYALDALGPSEHAAFVRHLGNCPDCTREVGEFAATTARLGAAVATPVPAHLKTAVLARVDTVRQLPPRVPAPRRPGGRSLAAIGRRTGALVLAACLAAVALGGSALWQHQRAQDAGRQSAQAERRLQDLTAVISAPDARTVTGSADSGARAIVIVSRARDRAVLVAAELPPAAPGRTYQLWYADGPAMRSAGLFREAGAHLLDGSPEAASAVGVTVEPAGGSEQPTSAPLMLMKLPA
ncbi:anti-sigma factor [Streptomyces sp. NPDC001985]|uniref:anti-sigma factor n=1 Tax=Streptomyces sp. NPDC001985 TaxID=3154406 RepID=UPI00331F27A5